MRRVLIFSFVFGFGETINLSPQNYKNIPFIKVFDKKSKGKYGQCGSSYLQNKKRPTILVSPFKDQFRLTESMNHHLPGSFFTIGENSVGVDSGFKCFGINGQDAFAGLIGSGRNLVYLLSDKIINFKTYA